MKKIIFGINSLRVGGMERQLIKQLPHFNQNKYELHIIILQSKLNNTDLLKEAKQYALIYNFNFASLYDFNSYLCLYKLMKKIGPDLVLSSLFFSNTVFRILKPFCGYSIISREHNTYIDKTRIQTFVDRVLSVFSKKIIAVSKEVADFTSKQELIDRDKFLVINNGIDIENIDYIRNKIDKKKLREELNLKQSDKIFITVSRLVPQKNHELLIKGFAKLLNINNCNNCKFLIVGDGVEKENIKDLLNELHISESVLMLGYTSDVHPYYAISDVYVATSKIEGMSNSQLEALAHGLPIVSTNTGGVSSIVKEGFNGFIIAEESEAGVLSALTKVVNGDINDMKNNSLKTRESFDIKLNVKKYEMVFDGGKTIECLGMPNSGKTTTVRYLENQFHINTIIEDKEWKKEWKKFGFIFFVSNLSLSIRLFAIAFSESIRVMKPMLFFHKLYIVIVTFSYWKYLHIKYPFGIRVMDEGFIQLILSIYESSVDEKKLSKIINLLPISDAVLYFQPPKIQAKVSKKRESMGEEYVRAWKKIFSSNLEKMKLILSNDFNVYSCKLDPNYKPVFMDKSVVDILEGN